MGITGTFWGSTASKLEILNNTTASNGGIFPPTIVSRSSDYYCTLATKYTSTTSGSVLSSCYPSITKPPADQSNYILVKYSSEIILFPFNHLYIKCASSGKANGSYKIAIGVGSPSMTGNAFSAWANPSLGSSETYDIDISELTGKYCIFVYLYLTPKVYSTSTYLSANTTQIYLTT